MSERLSAEQELIDEGWTLIRRGKTRVAMKRPKAHHVLFEDRVWTLLWRMQFPYLSGDGGAVLTTNTDPRQTLRTQIDVVAGDDEVGILVECKSQQSPGRRPEIQEDLGKLSLSRESFARALNRTAASKRTPILILWVQNAVLSRADRERAKQHSIALLTDEDLDYYEKIVALLGPAARFQFLSELTPGRTVPGLTIKIPALRAKVGGHTAYTFAISPAYLLKIAYVAHRRRSDVGGELRTYQRFATKSRLLAIAKYLRSDPNAMFPTNIVINLDSGSGRSGATFDRASQEEGGQAATLGWLTLRPAYKSAWIIDGQHRLHAYSFVSPEIAERSRLSVLAFEGLPGSLQQKLFIDINGEQKRVKRSLLEELYSDLHKSADDPRERTRALISESIQDLDADPDSPFFGRLLLAGRPPTTVRRISITAMFTALDRPGFYHGAVRGNTIVDPGPFWADADTTIVNRTTSILNLWFGQIRDAVPEWWALGAEQGGGLAMNDGVSICLLVLRSVVQHLDESRVKLNRQSLREVADRLMPFARALGDHFAGMSMTERDGFRALRGNQGQAAGMRHAQAFLQARFPDFRPDGLAEYLEREKAKTNEKASNRIKDIERKLQQIVIGVLKSQFGANSDRWWYDGVPRQVRNAASALLEEDKNSRGGREHYLFLIDYRTVALANWTALGPLLAWGKAGNKERRTEWMVRVNDIRKVAEHPSSGQWVSFEELSELDQYLEWLQGKELGDDVEAADLDLER